jgi:sulfoxide reductase heme-binding subunit YedZ
MKEFKRALVYVNYASLPIIILPFIFEIKHTYVLANWFGSIALIIFCITLTPGIIKRFRLGNVFKKTQLYLMFGRRQLGLLTFVYALIHYIWHQIYPLYEFGVLPAIEPFRAVGFVAITIFTILAITSNNYSVKLLKKNWQRLHRLVYLAAWLLFFHVALVGNLWQAILIGIFIVLEIISYIFVYMRRT